MERKSNISHYRGRLDKTLTSYDLENEEGLKVLVKNQILQSSHCEIEEYLENIVERRTKDVFNFLQMLKSASANDYEVSKSRETPRSGWKLKQDTEDYRVMYRQGPQGTPFHTLLVEGYVDGPLDVYASHGNPPSSTNAKPSQEENTAIIRIVWPQTKIPAFKIISSDCLQKVRIGEQISLVRMKVPWPLSAREVVVHFFEFEYFQDDLIVVLLNSISDLESIDRSTHGFSKDGIPDAQDVVRIDVVGGFALQKVTADRSYFRTITNLDMKLDFVPPSFINFISRQLIGSGFRLYKKEVASVSRGDEDFGKALKDQLYNRIREILYSDNKQKRALELGDTKNDVETFHEEHVLEVLSDHHATETFPEDAVVEDDHHATETFPEDAVVEDDHHATETFSEDAVVEDHKSIIEIEEIAEEDIEQSGHLEEGGKQISNPTPTQIEEKPRVNNKIIGVSPQVKQALETLDKVISICREYRLGPQTRSPEFTHKGSFDLGKNREKELRSLGNGQICASDQACVDALKNETVKRALHEPRNSSSSHCSRRMRSNSCSRETCHNKIAPASSEENLFRASETHQQTASYYSTDATTERTIVGGTGFDDKLANVDANAICKDGTKTGKHKKPKFCCFHLFSGSLMC